MISVSYLLSFLIGMSIQKFSTIPDVKSEDKHAVLEHEGQEQLTRTNMIFLRYPAPLYLEEEIQKWKAMFPRPSNK